VSLSKLSYSWRLNPSRLMRGTVCFLALLLSSLPSHAQTTANISITSETQSIYLGDSVILDIESSGLIDPLDVSLQKQSSDFLRESTGTRIAVVDGKVVEIALRRMEFIPTKEGTILYGPLTGESSQGKVLSNSISVVVQPALSGDWRPRVTDFEALVSFSNEQPIVGEQVVVDIKLRHKHQIANETISIPDFAGFDVLRVYEQRRTIETQALGVADEQQTKNGSASHSNLTGAEPTSSEPDTSTNEWRQIAWRLLLHAKRSGDIDIQPITWSGTMIKSRSQRGDFKQQFKSAALRVRPTPADRPDWWLPASSVQLSDSWSKDVRTLSAGDEIIRTITLRVKNVLSNQIPDIEPYPTRALTSTLIRSSRDHQINGEHTLATGVFEFRMVAQSPIPVFLDTVRVPWWNVDTNEHEEAIIPARRINVGLPDRADLLADLAINNSRFSRWIFNLRSYARWQPLLIAAGCLLALITLFPLIRDGVRHDKHQRQQTRAQQKLELLRQTGNWQGLYNEINRLNANNELYTENREFQQLMGKLQRLLFSNDNSAASHIARREIRLRFKPCTVNNNTELVAGL